MTKTTEQLKDEIFAENRINTSKYYLLYIDILGMKSKIDSKDSELYLNYINNLYRDAIKTISGLYEEINNIKINVRIFSDNMVIAIKQEENCNQARESNKHTLMIEIASYIQVLALMYSLPTRGSIAYDDFYIDENFIYGKALTKAYNLESEIAIYPRIIIEDKAVELFTASQYLKKFIKKDTDNVYYINPFECYFNIAKIYKEDEIKHIKQILWTKLPESNTCKINQKIHWLVNRFNEFCSGNQLEKYILDIDRLPRLSKYFAEAFKNVDTLDCKKQ